MPPCASEPSGLANGSTIRLQRKNCVQGRKQANDNSLNAASRRSPQRVRHQHRYGAYPQRRSQFSAQLRARCGPMRPRQAGRRRGSLFRDRQHRPTGNPGSRRSCPSGSRLPRLWRCDGDFGRCRNSEAAAPRLPKPTAHIIDWFHIAMKIQPMQQIADHMARSRSGLSEALPAIDRDIRA